MKFTVTMKDPDTLDLACEEASKSSLVANEGLSDDEIDLLAGERADTFKTMAAKWFSYGEYLTVEIDTDAQTCNVKEKKP